MADVGHSFMTGGVTRVLAVMTTELAACGFTVEHAGRVFECNPEEHPEEIETGGWARYDFDLTGDGGHRFRVSYWARTATWTYRRSGWSGVYGQRGELDVLDTVNPARIAAAIGGQLNDDALIGRQPAGRNTSECQ